MTDKYSSPIVLLETKRNKITDCEYFGSYYLADKNLIIKSKGYSESQKFFMRSLAKPLQASIIADCNIIKDYNLKPDEIAIMTGSHSGSPRHIEILKRICKRFKINLNDLELEAIYPLDERKFNGRKTKLHNNCSGKHILMVLMCKYLNINHQNYTKENHPLQKIIKKKQEELSKEKAGALSYDGCSTPLWAISAEGIINAYYNLMNRQEYSYILNSAISHPDIFGGYNRLDTEIIKLGKKNLYAKVGAGGFLIICNKKENKIFLLKITQNNNPIRRLIALDALNKLGWIKTDIENFEYNQKNFPVTKYCYKINLN